MAQFIQLGRHWINLDQVLRVELVPSRKDPEQVAVARIHYADGKHADFKDRTLLDELVEWLDSHKAS